MKKLIDNIEKIMQSKIEVYSPPECAPALDPAPIRAIAVAIPRLVICEAISNEVKDFLMFFQLRFWIESIEFKKTSHKPKIELFTFSALNLKTFLNLSIEYTQDDCKIHAMLISKSLNYIQVSG